MSMIHPPKHPQPGGFDLATFAPSLDAEAGESLGQFLSHFEDPMNKSLIDQLVDRFLACPLPESVKVDPCAMPETIPYPYERTGTNLLTASEAKQMLEHVLADLMRHPRLLEVLQERERQINVEGWTPEHDVQHDCGELAVAGACYLEEGGTNLTTAEDIEEYGPCPPSSWPWAKEWWKPTGGPERNLIKGLALGLAELERLDRQQ